MPTTTPDPLVIRVLNEFRAGLESREEAQFVQMARRWLQVEAALEGLIAALAEQAGELAVSGEALSLARVRTLGSYQALMAAVETQLARYGVYAENLIGNEQTYYAEQGLSAGTDAIRSMYIQNNSAPTDFALLNINAVETIAGLAADGSPISTLLMAAFPAVAEDVAGLLVQAIALGWNPRKTARVIQAITNGPLHRALRIARTEQMRAYREASRKQYEESGVVQGYKRLAAKSLRTCIACLIADGREYPLSVPFEEHVNGRCQAVPVLIDVPSPTWFTGKQWFLSLDEADQRSIMGTQRWDVWHTSGFDLERVIKVRHNETWGNSLQVRPVRELRTQGART